MGRIIKDYTGCNDDDEPRVIWQEGLSRDDLDIMRRTGNDIVAIKHRDKVDVVRQIWDSGGYIPGCVGRTTIQDIIAKDVSFSRKIQGDSYSSNQGLLLRRVVQEVAREAADDLSDLADANVFVRMNKGHEFASSLTIVGWGGFTAADIPEGGEYPERTLEVGGDITATIGKAGVAVKMSDEMVRFSQFDIMDRHIRAAGAAMSRHRESKIWNSISDNGSILFDNQDTDYLSTSGRNAAGDLNATISLDDLYHAYSTLVDRGYRPNTLIMHPSAWLIWTSEGMSRAFGYMNGFAGMLWNNPSGVGSANVWKGVQGGLNRAMPTSTGNAGRILANVPSIFPTPLRIVVSPFVDFDAETRRTTLVLMDDQEAGFIVEGSPLETEEWRQPERDIQKIKFRQFYSVGALSSGEAMVQMKNVHVSRSFDFSNFSVQFSDQSIFTGADGLTGDLSRTSTI